METIKILKHQYDFLRSDNVHTGLVAGFGAGKSKIATIKTAEKKKLYPGVDVAYYLPNYGLVRSVAFKNFREILSQLQIPFQLNKSDKEFITPLGKILLRSMTNADTIVGYEVGYSCIDESDTLKKKDMNRVFDQIIARNRIPLPDGAPNSTDLVSTPEGFEFMYDFFIKEQKSNRTLVRGKSTDNPFLPKSFFETLRARYSPEQLKAYLNGEFVNLNSSVVYYSFCRKQNHTDREAEARETLHIGMDFNVTNMNAIIHVMDGQDPIAVDEITQAHDTRHIIDAIQEKYPNNAKIIYPDASGQNRKSAGGPTDHDLLKRAGFIVKSRKSNPAVRDRVSIMNGAFRDGDGRRSYKVNTLKCPIYTESLEQQVYDKGVPDKKSGHDHATEAGGYFIYSIKAKKSFKLYS